LGPQARLYGTGISGYKDGPAAAAQFKNPVGLTLGPKGAVYVADEDNNVIRVIKDGNVSTLAGDGNVGFKDGGRSTC
jgi:hypothetical protein